MPGFIKPVNGNTRMRFVKPGYNPDDYNTPNEHVIFDSEDIGSLSILASGTYQWGTGGTGKSAQIASFNFGFVPLVYFLYSYDGGVSYAPDLMTDVPTWNGEYSTFTRVSSTGIVAAMRPSSSTWNIFIKWFAFDLAVF